MEIDLIWINGENFWTLKQANLLYGPFAAGLPNSEFVAWDNPAVNLDFGRPVEVWKVHGLVLSSTLCMTQLEIIMMICLVVMLN